MADQGESYPSGEDIRKREGQGEMAAQEAEERGGIDDTEELRGSVPDQVISPQDKERKSA